MEARMPRRYRPQLWMVVRCAASGDVENRSIKNGDFLRQVDNGGRVKGHEYLPLNAILSLPDAVPSSETTQPAADRHRAGYRVHRTDKVAAPGVRRRDAQTRPGPRRIAGRALQPF